MGKITKEKNLKNIFANSYQIGLQFCEIHQINEANIYKIDNQLEFLKYNIKNYSKLENGLKKMIFLPQKLDNDKLDEFLIEKTNKEDSNNLIIDQNSLYKQINQEQYRKFQANANNIIIQEQLDYSLIPEYIKNLDQLLELLNGYKFISIERERAMWLYQILQARNVFINYTHEMMFSESIEGAIWNHILNNHLLTELNNDEQDNISYKNNMKNNETLIFPYSTYNFNQLEALQGKSITHNVFPYMQYSEYANLPILRKINQLVIENKLVELFEELAGYKPLYKPSSIMQLKQYLKEAIIIERYEFEHANHIIIDKILGVYLDKAIIDKSIYIGQNPNIGFSKQLIYDTNYHEHTKWEENNIYAEINSAREQKLAIKGEYGALKASNLCVLNYVENLYSYIKDCVVKAIQARLKGYSFDESWKEYLNKSGYEYIKIAQKAENFIQLFLNWYKENNFSYYEFGKKIIENDNAFLLDFYAKTCFGKHLAMKFFWNLPSESKLYQEDVSISKIAQLKVVDYYFVMNYQKIIELNFDEFCVENFMEINSPNITIINNWAAKTEKKEQMNKKNKRILTKEDDLFYWFS